jgi:hypothetical protein
MREGLFYSGAASFTFRHLASAALLARSLAAGVPRIDEAERGSLAISLIRRKI